MNTFTKTRLLISLNGRLVAHWSKQRQQHQQLHKLPVAIELPRYKSLLSSGQLNTKAISHTRSITTIRLAADEKKEIQKLGFLGNVECESGDDVVIEKRIWMIDTVKATEER